jgi:hypothetical protein
VTQAQVARQRRWNKQVRRVLDNQDGLDRLMSWPAHTRDRLALRRWLKQHAHILTGDRP